MIEREVLKDGVAVVRLAFPPVNALDAEVLEAIAAEFTDLAATPAVTAVVLTGSGATFSAGADLFRVLEEGEPYARRGGTAFNAAFSSAFTFPRPVVAAVNGHAIAGGCVLACACDYRMTAAGDHKIGLAELRVGVPFPSWALEVVRFAVGPAHLQDVVFTARNFGPDDALRLGLVDDIVPSGELLDRAIAQARRFAAIPSETYALTKRTLRAPTVERLERTAAEVDEEVGRLWGSEPVREAISRFLIKTFGTDKR